jgi:hypothetical protein
MLKNLREIYFIYCLFFIANSQSIQEQIQAWFVAQLHQKKHKKCRKWTIDVHKIKA